MSNCESVRDWSIQEIARLVGTTSRTLRHYHEIGLLEPSRMGNNGYRFYNQDALIRLQRILLLRELGLGLIAIAEVLKEQSDTVGALSSHLHWLQREKKRLDKQISSIETTILRIERGEPLMAEEIFMGFQENPYKQEAIERFGRETVEGSSHRLQTLGKRGQQEVFELGERTAVALGEALMAGKAVDSTEVQSLVADHYQWVCAFWIPTREAYIELGKMYVDDLRFTAFYDKYAKGLAVFLSRAMEIFAESHLKQAT